MTRATWLVTILFAMSAARALGQARERLTVFGSGHQVVAEADGEPSRVVIDPRLDAILLQPGANLTIVHNHPNGVGLSAPDLLQLSKPGVAAIVATGADGSRYEALRGTRYDPDHFELVQYRTAHDDVIGRLQTERGHDPSLPAFDRLIAHLTTLALQKAGIVHYRYALGGAGAAAWDRYRPLLGAVTEGAASRVTASSASAR